MKAKVIWSIVVSVFVIFVFVIVQMRRNIKILEFERHCLALGLESNRVTIYKESKAQREQINEKTIYKYVERVVYDEKGWQRRDSVPRLVIRYALLDLEDRHKENIVERINGRLGEGASPEIIQSVASYYSVMSINTDMTGVIERMGGSENRAKRYVSMLYYHQQYVNGRPNGAEKYYRYMKDKDKEIQAQSYKLYEIAMGRQSIWSEEVLNTIAELPVYTEDYDILAISSALKGMRSGKGEYIEAAIEYLSRYKGEYGENTMNMLEGAKTALREKRDELISGSRL
jgi:hypothetical protein